MLDAEAQGPQLIAYDRPGYGGSDRHEGRGVDGCAADVAAICDALGLSVGAIRVPVLHWQGGADRLLPFGHGVWPSEHVAGVESRLDEEEGHLTLIERHVPEVHRRLAERYG